MNEKKLQQVLNNTTDGKKVFGACFALKKGDSVWMGSAGNLTIDQQYFIASTTKLFTTSLILRLQSENKLNINNTIGQYISPEILNKLHVYKGIDYSQSITIRHLLAHTSGLADYFQNKGSNGKSLEDEIVNGNDQAWNFEQAMERTKNLKAHFVPGTKNKAHYSDANFQLLGRIIESISGKSFAQNCLEHIISPLHLNHTYLYTDASDTTPFPLYYKTGQLHIPKAMASFGSDGGMVSTSADMLVFIEAFFNGKLFPMEYLSFMQEWNRIFFPMKSGVGIHKFELPWIFNPTGAVPAFIGHSGLSGALAYYSPRENLYVAGTVNQVAHPDISFRTMIKLAQIAKKSQ